MSNLDRARDELQEYYQQSLQRRVVTLDEWHATFDPADADQHTAIRRSAHQLRGSAASFGHERIGDLGGAVEDAPLDELHEALAVLIAEIHRALDAMPPPPTDAEA